MDAWSTEPPKTNGWYYAYENLPAEDADILCVWYNPIPDEAFTMDCMFKASDFSHWMPIELPDAP